MALMGNLRMSTSFRPVALIMTGGWLGTTCKGWLKYSPTAIACYLIEYGLSAAATWPFMTKFLTDMFGISALELATAYSCTNVLCLDVFHNSSRSRID